MTSFPFILFHSAFKNKHFQEGITVHGPEKLNKNFAGFFVALNLGQNLIHRLFPQVIQLSGSF